MHIIIEFKTDDGKPLGAVIALPKEFKTGSRGFYATTKIELDGKRYQTQVQMVEIGSKKANEKAG